MDFSTPWASNCPWNWQDTNRSIWCGGGRTHLRPHRQSHSWALHLAALRGAGQGWLAVSVGTADHAHAHHDLGSFLWETDGVRFVIDPGRLDYARKGYFKAERFADFGASAAAHNLPVFEPVSMRGWRTDIVTPSDADPESELVIRSTAPQGGAEVIRHFRLTDGVLRIEDRIRQGQEKPLRWQFHTDAQVEREGDHLLLRKMGRTVRVSVANVCFRPLGCFRHLTLGRLGWWRGGSDQRFIHLG